MKFLLNKINLFIIFFLIDAISLSAQIDAKYFPDKPNPPKLVNDFANVLSPGDEELLERKLVAFDDSTSTQIAVVTVDDTKEHVVEDYALYLGRYWGGTCLFMPSSATTAN